MKKKSVNYLSFYITKFLLVCLITVIVLIGCKKSTSFKNKFKSVVYEKNISFATINKYYNKIFGSQIPFKNLFENKIEPVFKESLVYSKSNIYKDGVVLTVDNKYMVPILKSGIVTFIGNKEGYGNTVIINAEDNVDVWYSNIENATVKMYDYVNEGKYLGNTTNDKLYLVFKKDGEVLDYKKFIK